VSELGDERILIGETPPQYVAEHFARYRFALPYCKGKTVFDGACGNGYGTEMIAKVAKQVIGADIYEPSIDFAKQNHNAPNIEYRVMDFDFDDLPDAQTYVCFETIEHLERPQYFLRQAMAKCQTIVFSVPMRCPWVYHKTDFNTLDDVKALFPEDVELWSQKLFEGDESIVQPATDRHYYTIGVWHR